MQLPYRCVRESQKALLVPVSTKGITVHHEREIEQHSIRRLIFNSTILFTVA